MSRIRDHNGCRPPLRPNRTLTGSLRYANILGLLTMCLTFDVDPRGPGRWSAEKLMLLAIGSWTLYTTTHTATSYRKNACLGTYIWESPHERRPHSVPRYVFYGTSTAGRRCTIAWTLKFYGVHTLAGSWRCPLKHIGTVVSEHDLPPLAFEAVEVPARSTCIFSLSGKTWGRSITTKNVPLGSSRRRWKQSGFVEFFG